MKNRTPSLSTEETLRRGDTNRLAITILGVLNLALVAAVVLGLFEGFSLVSMLTDFVLVRWAVYVVILLLALWLNYRGETIWAIRLILVGLAFVMIVVGLSTLGFGLVSSAALILLTVFVVLQARLPSRESRFLIIANLAASALLVILESVGPAGRTTQSNDYQDLVALFLGGLVSLAGAFAFRRWNEFPLRTKLLLAFVGASVIPVILVSYILSFSIRSNLTQDVGANLQVLAVNKAQLIANLVDREKDLAVSLASNRVLQDTAAAANTRFMGYENPASIEAEIKKTGLEWTRASANSALIQGVVATEAARELQRFRTSFPDNVQIFVTDRYGTTIAATERVASYYYGDQEWWKKAYGAGRNEVLVFQPQRRPDLTLGMILALPLRSESSDRVLGVLQVLYRTRPLSVVLDSAGFGKTGTAELVFPSGQVLSGDGNIAPLDAGQLAAIRVATKSNFSRYQTDTRGFFLSQAPVLSAIGRTSQTSELGWVLVVNQDASEALQSVYAAGTTTLLTGVGTLVLAGLLTLLGVQLLAGPILRLNEVAGEIAAGNLKAEARVESGDEIGRLAQTINRMTAQLRQTLENLEQRVQDRTQELARVSAEQQHLATQLQASAEVARAATSNLNLTQLLQSVTRLLGESFGLYHVGIYLLDQAGECLVLHAAHMPAAQNPGAGPLESSARVGDPSFVGYVTHTGERRVAQNVTRDKLFIKNPQLPLTRSEMTLPLKASGQVIGALDIQSSQESAFSDADVIALTGLASQIAIAIQNARSFERQAALAEENHALFEQAQHANAELNALTRRLTGEGWQEYLNQVAGEILIQDETPGLDVVPIQSPVFDQTAAQGNLVTRRDKQGSSLAAPIVVRGNIIGSLALEDQGAGHEWDPEEVTILRDVADHVALALDNARLFAEAQQELTERTRAEAETRQRNEQLAALNELGRALTQLATPAEIAYTIYSMVGRVLDNRTFYLALNHEEQQTVSFPIYVVDGKIQPRAARPYKNSLNEYLIRHQMPLLLARDVDAQIAALGIEKLGRGAQSFVAVPILMGSKTFGVIALQNFERPDAFGPADVEVLSTIASQAAAAFENARLYEAAQQELTERQRVQLELQRRLRETLLLNRVIATAAREQDPKVILQTVCDELAEFLHVPNILGGLADDAETRVEFLADHHAEGIPSAVGMVMPIKHNPFAEYLLSLHTPLAIHDARTDPRTAPVRSLTELRRTQSMFIVPLMIRDQVVGVLSGGTLEPREFKADELGLVQNIATTVCQALENTRLFETVQRELAERRRAEETVRRQNAYLSALQETTLGMIQRLDAEELLQAIIVRAGALLGTSHGYVYLLTPDEQEIEMRFGVGVYEELVGSRTRPGGGLAGQVWQTGAPINVADYRNWKDRIPDPRRDVLRAVIGVPLRSGDRVIGVLGLAHTQEGIVFGPDELDVLNRFTTLVSIALDNAQLYAAAQQELAERKRTEQDLASERTLLRTIIDSTPDWIFIKDREHRFRMVNQGYARSLHLKPEELIGKTDIDLGIPEELVKGNPEKGIVGFWTDDLAVMDSRQIKIIPEEPIVLDDGPHYLSTVKVPLTDPDGEVWGVLGFVRDITENKNSAMAIEQSLREKEVMLKEIHHRVKNNLQVISSLLNLQATSASDPKTIEVLRDSQMRVRSMALVHEKLYRSKDLAHIDFDGYVRNLSSVIFRSFGGNARNVILDIDIPDLSLSIDRAVPCGLIINELLSNALKYAFPGRRRGQVRIEMQRTEQGQLALTVHDDGVGLPPGLDFRNTESLGMQLVNTLTGQLGGSIELHRNSGTAFRITFPL